MDKFWALFGKFMLVALFIGALAGGGYYLGRSGKVQLGQQEPQPNAVTTVNPTITQITDTPSPSQTVTAGLGAESGLSFTKYQVTAPENWIPNHTTENIGTAMDTLTLTNGQYQLKIYQAATGGAMCVYPGDPPFEGPSSTFADFVGITGTNGITYRRAIAQPPAGAKKTYTICQKGPDAYGQPTNFGHMSYTTPTVPDQATLQEMDAMVASLTPY